MTHSFIENIQKQLLETFHRDVESINKKLISLAKKHNGKAYLVGGAVRDELMGQPSKDYDYVITKIPLDILAKELQTVFPSAKIDEVGKSFGIIKMRIADEEYDIAIPRADENRDNVKTDPNIPIEKDLMRRDTTMNSLAKDLETGEIVSPSGFNGVEDIKNKIIRAVGNPVERFEEDPLRILRVISQAARFGFSIDTNTLDAIKRNVDLLKKVSGERFEDEFFKGWTKGNADRKKFFELLQDTGIGVLMFGSDFKPIALQHDNSDVSFIKQVIAAFLNGGNIEKLTKKTDIVQTVKIARTLYNIFKNNGNITEKDIRELGNFGNLFEMINKVFYEISENLGEWLQNWLSKPVIPYKQGGKTWELPVSGGDLIEISKKIGKELKGKAISETTMRLILAYRNGEIEIPTGNTEKDIETITQWMQGILKEAWFKDLEQIDILRSRISNIFYK